jgi:tetratricopeptide (TPR) repeat protein
MADEAHEPQEGEITEEPSAPAGSYLSRNWPLPALAMGVALLTGAVWYWKGPSARAHRERFLEDLGQARQLADSSPYNARPVLGGLFGRLTRVPEAKGEVYYLLGRVNDELAISAENDLELANQYRRAGLEAYSEADQVGVGPNLTLPLAESLGKSLIAVGPTNRFSEANMKLADALARRDVVAWVIQRRRVQAMLLAEEVSKPELEQVLRQWNHLQDLPSELADERAETARAIESAIREDAPWPVGTTDADPRLAENQQAREVDDRLRLAIDLDPIEQVLELAQREEELNDTRRSEILKSMAQAAMKGTTPSFLDAEGFAQRRLQVDGAPEELKADALLDLAEILLSADRPADAQAALARVEGSPAQKRRASYLLGKSLLDRADLIDRTPMETYLKQVPKRTELATWVARQREVWGGTGDQKPSIPSWLVARSLDLLNPLSLKNAAARGAYQQAIATFSRVLEDTETPDDVRLETKLWTGLAYEGLHHPERARTEFEEVIRELGSGPLEQAARLFLANSWGRSNHPAESVQSFTEVFKQIGNPIRYQNKYLRASQIRDMLVDLWNYYQVERRDSQSALHFAGLLCSFRQPNTEPGEPDDLFARSNSALAQEMMLKHDQEVDRAAKGNWAERARGHARDAGQAFLAVAKAREGSDDYPALLWEAATHLFQGHAFEKAGPVFEKFIVAHVGGPRDFLAKIRTAECHLAQSDYPAARTVLENALRESSTAVDRFRGRILLAECYREIARQLPASADTDRTALYALAEQLLLQNLSSQNQELEPQAADWRDSLLELAQLLLERKRYDEAIDKFREYVRRYPAATGSVEAAYGIASAYFDSAEDLTPRLSDEAASERDRARARQERRRRLESALTQFQILVNQLSRASGNQALQREDDVLLGTALGRVGRIHMLLEQWEEAIKSYENLAFRYLDRPECLGAYIEMATAYQKLNRPTDAATALRQALWVIDRMDDKAFTQTDRKRDEIRQQIVDLLGAP